MGCDSHHMRISDQSPIHCRPYKAASEVQSSLVKFGLSYVLADSRIPPVGVQVCFGRIVVINALVCLRL